MPFACIAGYRAELGFAGTFRRRYACIMTVTKIILIIVLLSLAFHLLLFGYMKRRIAAAKRKEEQRHD